MKRTRLGRERRRRARQRVEQKSAATETAAFYVLSDRNIIDGALLFYFVARRFLFVRKMCARGSGTVREQYVPYMAVNVRAGPKRKENESAERNEREKIGVEKMDFFALCSGLSFANG